MKLKRSFILLSTTLLLSPVMFNMSTVSASEANMRTNISNGDKIDIDEFEDNYLNSDNLDNIEDVDQIFLDTYNESKNLEVEDIEADEDLYGILLKNPEQIFLNSAGLLEVDYVNISDFENFSENDKNMLIDFVERMNFLVSNRALSIDDNLLFSYPYDLEIEKEVETKSGFSIQANIISIMTSTRKNAKLL
ncbi:hypothetical protein VXN63_06320 [Marinilactibacillus sp. XAAS-LB27]|uniref:hypothetical protein n=1 Tax=Marinilactibacillus sp. XAAS-LB27 TaxID=3114538 RepID=UPI002E176273|nr:hypothetical protein [Marinilactibacillus sp. XAAS-LB27]